MPRQPAHLVAAAKRPVSRDAMWATIRRLGTFTVPQLAGETNIQRDTIKTYVGGLEAAGYVERVGLEEPVASQFGGRTNGNFRALVYRLVRDVGVEAPRVRRDGSEVQQGRGRDHMWRAAKMIGDFTHRDLAVHASTEAVPIAEGEAKSYVQYLTKAGYLAVIRPANPHRLALYRFLKSRNTGPQAPQVQRVKQVFDPNLGEVVWTQEARS